MERLVTTNDSCIVFGEFKGVRDEELYRGPRNDEDTLKKFINENAIVLPLENDTETTDLSEVPNYLAYYRMYWRNGWYGRWMIDTDPSGMLIIGVKKPEIPYETIAMVAKLQDWIENEFRGGCDYHMEDFMRKNFEPWGDDKIFLLKPPYVDNVKIQINTTYGNSDYPVRIYVYEEKPGNTKRKTASA